jgi:hypothetical protein
MRKLISKIQLGTWFEYFLLVITFGQSQRVAKWIAIDLLGYTSCFCCERKQIMNRWTNPNYDGKCNQIKLF